MEKRNRKRSDRVLTMPADETALTSRSTVLAADVIERLAYELYEERGREDGHDLDDWLRAERELRGTVSSSAA